MLTPSDPSNYNGKSDVSNYSSSEVKFKVAADGNAHITDSSVPEAEITPATERNSPLFQTWLPFAEEKIIEIDLILPENDPNVVPNPIDSDEEKFITVFEISRCTAERDKDNPEDISS